MKHLKLEELKVGNYVLHNFYRIKLDGSLFAQYIQNELEKKFYPIDLTTDFLDKTSFIKHGNNYEFWRNSAFSVELIKGNWEILYMSELMSKRVKYIHELQNFYYEVAGEMLWVSQHSI
jgi:hypothetical protein